jgi:putative toxin-antitoxin system antitoxin component (TIGR02293 family)
MMVVDVIRKGIPNSLFMSIKDMAPFSDQEWSDFLDISLKSLQRYKKESGHVFSTIHSEKIVELAEVTSVGLEVFDPSADFATWLNSPCLALGNSRPMELLRDSYGTELVLYELQRIDQGIFV